MNRSRDKQLPRRGIVTVLVIVILIMITAMTAELVRRTMTDRRQVRREHELQQAVQLAESGLLIAENRLAADPEYSDQTIEFPAGALHASHTGQLRISVKDNLVKATARYPDQSDSPVQITRTRKVNQ